MAEHRDRLGVPVLVGVGAAYDFHTGRSKQAPWSSRGTSPSAASGSFATGARRHQVENRTNGHTPRLPPNFRVTFSAWIRRPFPPHYSPYFFGGFLFPGLGVLRCVMAWYVPGVGVLWVP